MKVICSGMPKTGTKSLSAALRILGYTVYDIEEQFFYIGDELMNVMENGWTVEDIRRIFDGVDAVTDIPGCMLWEDLLKAFPEAKVVHSERATGEEWVQSFSKQIESMIAERAARYVLFFTPTGNKFRRFIFSSMRLCVSIPPANPVCLSKLNKSFAQLRYRQHNAYVRETVPENKLLLFKVAQGWGPLCKFLNKSVPDQPFPHRNKGGEISKEFVDHSYVFYPIKKEFAVRLLSFVVLLTILIAWLIA